ncbi:MAG: hypothetical protein K6U04_12070 [Armatimonadetes bacterium]|nr:hypothetical protein [Armatimonadota bacterium]
MDVPEEIADQKTLAGIFFTIFGSRWNEVLVGAEKPFSYHRDWRAYFAVSDLAGCAEELFLADLLVEKQTCRIFSILTG